MTTPATTYFDSLPDIAGYTICEQLYLGSRTGVYRAIQNKTQRSVIIKVLRREFPSFGELVQFRNQYTIAKNLPITGIVRPLSLEPLGTGYALVMEDWGGVALGKYIQKHSLSLMDVLVIALQIADILHDLCQHQVVHKDIKPANILIHPESKQIKLIDFSIASLLPNQTQEVISPNVLEGTLAYLAPEQTGRMNRGIDYRTDFYGLGVTLYQLLTRTLPFVADDPLELMHSHIAKIPVSVDKINTEIPTMVSAIVAKLMSKNAEDRYQSAMGLKYDLSLCLTQLTQIGQIQEFKLGQRDLSERFNIPEKLYGRETQVQSLLAAFDRVAGGSSELMLVAGFSGIGKTAVVNEVHKPIVRQRGYFIKGKFDQFNRNIPLSAFVKALRDLMGQLLSESDQQIARWQTEILAAVGENGQLLIEVIPELEKIIGKQPTVSESPVTTAQNRFNRLFQNLIEVFATPEHPLVIFLDDLQWVDAASLQLLKLLVNSAYLLILGAYRDSEVSPTHPFMMAMEEIKQSRAIVNTITLQALVVDDTNRLVADTLNCSSELAKPLTELIARKTQGNPFFTTQFLKTLYSDGHIRFDSERSYWECDISQINALSLTSDVVEFMALQLQKLPVETQHILKFAACVGNQFDLKTLAIISEQSTVDVATALWKALQEGLVLPTTQIYKFFHGNAEHLALQSPVNPIYRFLHDRVQQAAYSLIPETERAITHYQIGQLLLKTISPSARQERIFELVNQLNYGIVQLEDQNQRDNLAQLNLIACRKAKTATAYQSTYEYACIGLQLLGVEGWQRQYELTLTLHELAAEAAWLCGFYEQMEQLIKTVLQATQTPLEQVNVYQIKIQALVSQNNLFEAIAIGNLILQLLGVYLPDNPTPEYIQQEIQAITDLIADRPIEELFHLPKMVDKQQLAILKIASTVIPAFQITNSPLFPFIATLQVKRSIEFGNSPVSGVSYLIYGVLLNTLSQAIELAEQFGQLAYRLALEPDAKNYRAITLVIFGIWIHHRKSHLRETLSILQMGYQEGIETGTLDQAGYNGHMFCWYAFWSGLPLAELEPQIRTYRQQLLNFNQINTSDYCGIYWETTLLLLDPLKYQELPSRHEELLPHKLAVGDVSWVSLFYLHQCTINFLLGDITQAQQQILKAKEYLEPCINSIGEAILYFYDSLIALAITPKSDEVETQQQRIQTNQKQLQFWSHYAPMNYLHKWELVEAERYRVCDHKVLAIEYYDKAIANAKANGYIQEEALSNELAAKFYLGWGKEKIAQDYLIKAYYGYTHWGAKAKVLDLEQRFPNLLTPILQQQQIALSATETLIANASVTMLALNTTQSTSSGSTSISATLDLATVLKASQALSSEIQFDKLLAILLHTVIENAGADKGVLLMPRENEWFVEAVATLDQPPQILSIPLSDSQDIPHTLINIAKRNIQPVVIFDALTHPALATDTYIMQHSPKSLLCNPILQQGKLIAILYLENHITVGAFTNDRVELLNVLCTQAAISLENARLYVQEQQKTQVIAQKEAEYRSIFESVNDGLSICDLETGQFIAANPTACQMYGYSLEEWLYLTPPDFTHPDSLYLFSSYLETLHAGKEFYAQGISKRKDGSFFDFEVKSVPLIYKGKLHGLNILRDISDRKRAETELQLKTQALTQSLQDLEQAQLQTVQSEKMASLGNLVAGVAHEINNPIGFLNGSINNAKDYVQDILGHLALYQQYHPNTAVPVQDNAEEIDLEFIAQDLPKLLNSMKDATNRIKSISTSLRTFSRADTEQKISVNLHEGIDSTLLILKYRLKANEHRPAIEVIQDYGDLPNIECFPGQLNQVFMNILANAIDVFDEAAQQTDFTTLVAKPQKISIQTAIQTQQNIAEIRIRDNGKGMSQETQARIFDHLFTTKPVGKGTGLGLAIARQIIFEKHGGQLEVQSELGQGTEFCIYLPICVAKI